MVIVVLWRVCVAVWVVLVMRRRGLMVRGLWMVVVAIWDWVFRQRRVHDPAGIALV